MLKRNKTPMTSEIQTIKEQIRDYILQTFLPGEDSANLLDDTALRESGILDSLSTLKLVTFIEETYGITLEPHEASTEIDKIEDIAALVHRKL